MGDARTFGIGALDGEVAGVDARLDGDGGDVDGIRELAVDSNCTGPLDVEA